MGERKTKTYNLIARVDYNAKSRQTTMTNDAGHGKQTGKKRAERP